MARGSDPRQSNARQRRKAAQRFAAADEPCAICHGTRGPIDYGAPRNHRWPLSLAIDELVPVARWFEGGYESPKACACDPRNWQPAHWICNAQKGDKMNVVLFRSTTTPKRMKGQNPTSGAF